MVNSVGTIELKIGEDRQRKLTANHQQFKNCIKQLIGLK